MIAMVDPPATAGGTDLVQVGLHLDEVSSVNAVASGLPRVL